MRVPQDLRYSADHEWVRLEGSRARIGITDYSQGTLGSVRIVDFAAVGTTVRAGQPFGEVESAKAVSELYAPLAGTVVAVNESLGAAPELLNDDPYGAGWLCEIEVDDPGAVSGLLDAAAYLALLEG